MLGKLANQIKGKIVPKKKKIILGTLANHKKGKQYLKKKYVGNTSENNT